MSAVPDEAAIRGWLLDYLVEVVGCVQGEADPDAPLRDLGLGSTDVVVLAGELSELLGRTVTAAELFEHPTVNSLAAALAGANATESANGAGPTGSTDEPIAVIGIGCRFPSDINDPDAFWAFLESGECAVGEVPDGRWNDFIDGGPPVADAVRGTTRFGAFLSDIAGFDADYFGISPNEAAKMDPQQRLFLEVAHQAIEHAGIPVDSLAHSQTGVFAGACAAEYGYLVSRDLAAVDGWSGTGSALSVVSNRVSYALDLRGPSVTIDSACSSSLVTIHLACRSLRSGETDLALAGGVNVMLSPAITRSFDQLDAMSPTGRCHSFDAAADGYVRGEGCGVVVLKRLSDARRDGDRILAVVRGSAVNQDGRSNGLTAPNPAAQAAVLRAAYTDAGIAPRDVEFVETHGTGTLLGDPIEARALGTVLGRGRTPDAPLLLGAVKSNLGHLEAAAGVAGFIKSVLALRKARIPANLGYTAPNPHIPFDAHRLRVVGSPTDWPAAGHPRRAGVSSFGFGGTNAHVVLEQAPDEASDAPSAFQSDAGTDLTRLTVPAGSVPRVQRFADVLANWLETSGSDSPLSSVAAALAGRGSRGGCFGAVVAADRDAAVAGLRALAAGASAAGVVPAREPARDSGVVFVFSGQGAQWTGMGQRLLTTEPAFADAVADLDQVFVEQVGFSLAQVLRSGRPVEGIDRIQPVLIGVQLALVELWRSHGIVPDAVIGHSMGEVSAAIVSGGLSVADGLRVIATRSRLMRRELSGRGAMALIEMDEASAEILASEFHGVSVAVVASPRQTVVAGDPDRIAALMDAVVARGLMARRVDVDVASHHRTVDPILDELRAELACLAPRKPTIPVLSTVLAGDTAPPFDADYWASNLRSPVRFAAAVADAADRWGTFVEVSPHPVLTHAVTECLPGSRHHVTGTVARDGDERLDFHTALASLGRHPDVQPRKPRIELPATPWLHSAHWMPPMRASSATDTVPRIGTVLGGRTRLVGTQTTDLWRARIAPTDRPYPGFHRVHQVELVPISVLLATFAAAASDIGAHGVDRLGFETPLVLNQHWIIHVILEGDLLTLSSAPGDDGPWTVHATARLAAGAAPDVLDPIGPDAVDDQARGITEPPAEWGVEGTPFPWSVSAVRRSDPALVVDVATAQTPITALLDAAVGVSRMVAPEDSRLLVPAAVDSLHVVNPAPSDGGRVTVRARDGRTLSGSDAVIGGVDVDVTDAHGTLLAELRGLRFAPVGDDALLSDAAPSEIVHTLEWRTWTPEDADRPRTVTVIGDEQLAAELAGTGLDISQNEDIDRSDRVLYVPRVRAEESDLAAATRLTCEVLDLVRAVNRAGTGRVWLLTHGVADGTSPSAAPQSVLWGLAGVIAAEHPESWGGLLDLPAAGPVGEGAPVAEALRGRSREPLRLRDGAITVGVPAAVPATDAGTPMRCRPDAAYLVTGGLGSLGLAIAVWLADKGARRIILAGRTPLPARAQWNTVVEPVLRERIDAVAALEQRGVAVETIALDIAAAGALTEYLADRDRQGAPAIRGIVHAAGVQSAMLIDDVDAESVDAVLEPKVAGARALADAFPPGTIDFLHLVGSAGAVYGVPGQSAYAAANAYLDGLARRRHHEGATDVLALDWVAWQDMGFGAGAEVVRRELERMGSRPVRPAEAFAAWEYAAAHGAHQAIMVPRPGGARPDAAGRDRAGGTPVWSQMSPSDALASIESGLRDIVARELRMSPAELTADRPFAEIGLNSVMAMSIRRDAETLVGTELSVTMLWNHPTLGALARHLAERVGASPPGSESRGEPAAEQAGDGLLDNLFDSVEGSVQ
ncbi:type I polyketide synthase [Tsukamurella strandjordii]|uniref:Acyltransferase domain-containing protein n=1 Tax=Tsukamurella strandjordii TaxID=147577 RepID=A0AA90NAH7_9ACTN|nr:type I polyketide synthase [Tsukamurella strandjordii]MDP0398897.1 acyltransferase domain-containing protein [Tsukamurella strandjordii]